MIVMGFNFHFGLPPILSWLVGLLFQLIVLGVLVVAAVAIVRRLKAAWRHGGMEPLPKEASRRALLDKGMPILSLRDGQQVGLAKDVILDMKSRSVVGFRARGRFFWHRRYLPFERVRGVGRDVITVDSASALLTAGEAPALAELARAKYLREDCEVVTEGGTKIGKMSWRNLWFDRETGQAAFILKAARVPIVSHVMDAASEVVSAVEPAGEWTPAPWGLEVRLPLTTVINTSRHLVIVNAEAESLVQQQAQEQMARTKEQAAQVWEKVKTSAREVWEKVSGKGKGVNG
ncbi:MAG: PRC-barrel domain-containing protein [Abditibacteriales bacterium]|nr:PRC-barrel domain-containing protein [Abditibacteriales bacterium]MDW8367583.1 PRC-barrel domain-containing protein [Abditibacteriales bacterium]